MRRFKCVTAEEPAGHVGCQAHYSRFLVSNCFLVLIGLLGRTEPLEYAENREEVNIGESYQIPLRGLGGWQGNRTCREFIDDNDIS